MLKLIQITDTHITPPGVLVQGDDPSERLAAVLDDVAAKHADAAAVILTGDLVDAGDEAAYGQLRSVLGRHPLPYRLTIGNHDHRPHFAKTFPDQMTGAFAQQALSFGEIDVVLLDSCDDAPTHAGRLCDERLAWLDRTLAGSGARQILIFVHHAPVSVGIARTEASMLMNGDALWRVLEPHHERIGHLFFGHMHLPVSGGWRGLPFLVLQGTAIHNHLDFADPVLPGRRAPPAYAVILADEAGVIVHTQPMAEPASLYDKAPWRPHVAHPIHGFGY